MSRSQGNAPSPSTGTFSALQFALLKFTWPSCNYAGDEDSPTKAVSEEAEDSKRGPKTPQALRRRPPQEPATPQDPTERTAFLAFQTLKQLHSLYKGSQAFAGGPNTLPTFNDSSKLLAE